MTDVNVAEKIEQVLQKQNPGFGKSVFIDFSGSKSVMYFCERHHVGVLHSFKTPTYSVGLVWKIMEKICIENGDQDFIRTVMAVTRWLFELENCVHIEGGVLNLHLRGGRGLGFSFYIKKEDYLEEHGIFLDKKSIKNWKDYDDEPEVAPH